MTSRHPFFLSALVCACAPALFAQEADPLALALKEDDAPAPAAVPAAVRAPAAPVVAGPTVLESFADLLLADLRGAEWLVAKPGPLADAVEARAKATGAALRVLRIDATGGPGPALTEAEAAALPPRVRAARDLGAAPFVLTWLRSDPATACARIVLADFPTLPEAAGFSAVPDGAFFRLVRAAPDDPSELLARHAVWRDEAGELLSRDPEGSSAAPARAHVALLDNELGVLLAGRGRSAFPAAAEAFLSANSANPGAVSPLLNLASLAREGTVPAGDSRPRIAGALQEAVSRARPDVLWALAVGDGRVFRPADFFDTGWVWALSGCLFDDTNSLAAAFAHLPDAEARRALLARLAPGIAMRDGNSRLAMGLLSAPELEKGWTPDAATAAARALFDAGVRDRARRLLETAAALPGADAAALAFTRLDLDSRAGELTALPDARAAVAACEDPAERLRRRLAVVAALIEAQAPFPELRDEAEAALREAGSDAPAWLEPVARAAGALADRNPVLARAVLEDVPTDDPGAWPAVRLLLLSELFTTGTGDTHAAALLALRPRDHLAHYVLGNRANVVDHDPAAAIAHLQASVAERPTWMALNDLASLLAAHGDPRIAETMARDALRITGGTMPAIHDTLGEARMAQRDAEGAADAFREALRLSGADGGPTAVYHLHLAEALLAGGDALGALDEIASVDARVSELSDDADSVLRLENLRQRAETALHAAP